MKLKAIFILLNAVLGSAFVVIFFTPLVLLGGEWFRVFWARNWPIAVVFCAAMGAVDAYFGLNWRLFRSLEKEDWADVAVLQEQKIFRRGRILASNIRLLLNTYLVTSNTDGILALESFLSGRKPAMVPRFSLSFGIPHLLAKDPADSEAFFRGMAAQPGVAERDWVSWNHAFSLLQLKRSAEARDELTALAERATDPVLLLLTLYLMDALARTDPDLDARIAARRDLLRARYTPDTLQKAIEKSGGNMQVAVLSRLLQDALEWLFAETHAPAAR